MKLWFLMIFCCLYSSLSMAETVHIEAEHLEIKHEKRLAEFVGKVFLQRGDFSLWSDKLLVYYKEDSKKIEHVHAAGNVRIQQGERLGKSDEADLYHLKDLLILRGNAEMEQEGGYIQGDIIEHDMKASETKVHQVEGGRVRVSIDSE